VGGAVLARSIAGLGGDSGPMADAAKFFKDNPAIANATASGLGSAIIATAQGGDVGKAITDGVSSSLVASGIKGTLGNSANTRLQQDLVKYLTPVVQAAVTGGDVERALQTSIVSGAVDYLAKGLTQGQTTSLQSANKASSPVYKNVDFAKESFKQTFGQTLSDAGAEALLNTDITATINTLKDQQDKYGVSASEVANWINTGSVNLDFDKESYRQTYAPGQEALSIGVDFAKESYRKTFGQALSDAGAQALASTNDPAAALKELKTQQDKYGISTPDVNNFLNTSSIPLGTLLASSPRDFIRSVTSAGTSTPTAQPPSTYWRIEDPDSGAVLQQGGVRSPQFNASNTVVVGAKDPGWEWAFDEDGSGIMWNQERNILQFVDADGNTLKTLPFEGQTFSSFVEAAKDSIPRGGLQLAMLLGDVLPAYGAKLIGNENYFKNQMEEAKTSIQKINSQYPARLSTYTDINGFGDAAVYAVEAVLEGLVSTAPTLLMGGPAGLAARSSVKIAVDNAVKKALAEQAAKGVFGAQAIAAAQNAAMTAGSKVAAKYVTPAILTASAAQNIPEVFLNVYEAKRGDVGLSDTLVAGLVGTFNAALDAVLPSALLKKINLSGVPAEDVIGAWYKQALKTGGNVLKKEGGTEALQEISSAAAESFVADNKEFFTAENLNRFIDAGLKGGLGGVGTTSVLSLGAGAVQALTPQQLYSEGVALNNATPENYNKTVTAFKNAGYANPTADEIASIMGAKPSPSTADITSAVNTFVDARTVTEQEVRQYFKDLGYTPTTAEVSQFIQSGPNVSQDNVFSSIEMNVITARDERIASVRDYVDAANTEVQNKFNAMDAAGQSPCCYTSTAG
jgi:hypothetical protein